MGEGFAEPRPSTRLAADSNWSLARYEDPQCDRMADQALRRCRPRPGAEVQVHRPRMHVPYNRRRRPGSVPHRHAEVRDQSAGGDLHGSDRVVAGVSVVLKRHYGVGWQPKCRPHAPFSRTMLSTWDIDKVTCSLCLDRLRSERRV